MEGPGLDEPAADGDIMLMAITDSAVTIKKSSDSSAGSPIDTNTAYDMEHNQPYQLNVNADTAASGTVKITVAPGLKITDYYQDPNHTTFESVTADITNYSAPNYAEAQSDTLEYKVIATASRINIDVSLSVDTVLWPKTDSWLLDDAIKVEFIEDDGSTTATKTADITVKKGVETEASYNRLYSSDSNNSVPGEAGKEFRMKIFQISPNLHGTPMGFYYKELKVTIPLPKVQTGNTYAKYSHMERINGKDPDSADTNEGDHTVTFTWTDIYVPAGSTFSFTPYFQWDTPQAPGAKVVFTDPNKFNVTATPYSGDGLAFAINIDGSTNNPVFTVMGDVAVNITGGGGRQGDAQIFNYGSTEQVYNLGQFLVRNDGFGDTGTGELTLKFSFSTDKVHVIAQGIPVGSNDGTVKRISYKTDLHPSDTPTDVVPGNYRNTFNNRSYMLMAPKGEYFTEITAVISGLPALAVCYNNSAALSPGNGAVTFGTMAAPETTGAFTPTLTITGGSLDPAGVTGQYTSTIVTTGKNTTQMQMAAGSGGLFTFDGKSTNSVQLGTDVPNRTIHYNAVISATTYPYTNNQVVEQPVIYLRLPDAITVPSVKLSSVQTGGPADETEIEPSHYEFTEPEETRGGDGFHVYKIEFKDNAGAIGCFNQYLGESQLRLEFDMLAATDIKDMDLKMCETIFVGYADGSVIHASGSLASSQRADRFDVDGDGDDSEYFSTMTDVDAHKLTIKAPRIGLTFNSYAKLSTEGDEKYSNFKAPTNNPEGLVGKGTTMYLTGNDQTIDFQFTAENKTGSDITIESDELGKEDFYYYIPVPKIGDNWDSHIQDSAFGLNMILQEVTVAETGATGLVDVLYSTTVDSTDPEGGSKHYNNADAVSTNYKPLSAVDLNDVKMIRISIKSGTAGNSFPNGYKATFTIKYKFELNAEELVGSAVEFGPCGITSYKRSGSSDSGHTPTQRVRAELQTGRIAGRVFVDMDWSGGYTAGDYFIEFAEGSDPATEHKAFLDLDGNGKQEGVGEIDVTMDLHAKGSEFTHYAQKPTFENNPYGNTYAISGLRAEEYELTVANPGYYGGVLSANSLRFIELKAETGEGSRKDKDQLAPASSYATGFLPFTTAKITIAANAENVKNNRMRDIALQRPHEVRFQVEYEDAYGEAPKDPDPVTIYVWHDTTITGSDTSVPDFTSSLDGDFQWPDGGPVWKCGDDTLDPDSTPITENVTYTATAVRAPHDLHYDSNDVSVTEGSMPADTTGVTGEWVTLDSEHIPSGSVEGKAVVFIGWTEEVKPIQSRDDGPKNKEYLGCVTSVLMDADGVTVYALWGYDENGNGTADVLEEQYTLTYHANGGDPKAPAPVPNLLVNESVPLDKGSDMTHAPVEGKTVLFVGWSDDTAVQSQIYGQSDTSRMAEIESYLLKESVTMSAADKTVYAVWAYDENGNSTPDYREDTTYGVLYELNGGEPPAALTAAQNTPHLSGVTVTLWQPDPAAPWTKGSKELGTQAVFVGWRADNTYAETPVKTKPTDLITEATTPSEGSGSHSVTVYAVWAEDKNGNDVPDYLDPQITIRYDRNGGTGAGDFPDQTGLVAGASYPLTSGAGLTREDPGHPDALFIGWSRTPHPDIVPEDTDKAASDALGIVSSPYLIPADEKETTIILYAIYGADHNGNGRVDYLENVQQVDYYPNGGQQPDGTPYEDDAPFHTCNHHHVAGEIVTLESLKGMSTLIQRPGAVLIGWSKTPQALLKEKPADGVLINEVEIPSDGSSNATVYAVWAADENDSHTPDYNDEHYSLTYYYNSALVDWRPQLDVDMDPTNETEINPDSVAEIRYENAALPETVTNILVRTCVDMEQPVLKARTDLAADGTELHHYIQLGWSGYCHPAAASTAQANQWLIEALDQDPVKPGPQRRIDGPLFQFCLRRLGPGRQPQRRGGL